MTTFVIIATIFVAAYLFAAVTFYYGFKNWHPMCGGKSAAVKGEGIRLRFSDRQLPRKNS
jgi:hypothetical protein